MMYRAVGNRFAFIAAATVIFSNALPSTAAKAAPAPAPAFVKETAATLPGHNIYRPANLAKRRSPVPVIVWANGGCAPGDPTWTILFERWASEGYFVITIHRAEEYEKMAARFAEMAKKQTPGTPPPAMPAPPPGALNKPGGQAFLTAEDQRKSIDWATTANKTGPYARKLDLKRVIAAGNSCGGISSLTLASTEPRVKSVFVLSGSSVGPNAKEADVAPTMGKVKAPAIWVIGGPEDIARPAAEMDYALQPPRVGGVLIQRSSFDHRMVSTDTETLRDVAEMGLLWFRATLNADRAAAAILTTKACAQCDPKIWTVAKAKNMGGRH